MATVVSHVLRVATCMHTLRIYQSQSQRVFPLVIVLHIFIINHPPIIFSFEVMIINTIQTEIAAKNTSVLTQIPLLYYLN